MPSASESFDTYLTKAHHASAQHCTIKHKGHHCKNLKRASQSLDPELLQKSYDDNSDYGKRKRHRRHFTIGDTKDGSEDVEELDDENIDDVKNGSCTRGAQSWRALRAVVAYYCSLRKIKREDIIKIFYLYECVCVSNILHDFVYFVNL